MTGKVANLSSYPNGFNGGLSLRGIPMALTHTGKVFYVGGASTTAAFPNRKGPSNGNKGTFLDPFTTIDYAVGQCLAGRGDTIIVLPGHVEDIASATSLVLDVADVAIIGLGTGAARAQLNYSATGGTVDVTADNVSLVNLVMKADVSAVVLGIDVSANYFTLQGCEFNYNATGDDFVTMLDIDAVTDADVTGNRFYAEPIAGCSEAIRLDTATRARIVGNAIQGDFTDGCIIGEGAASLDIVIADNLLYNADTTAGFVVDLNVACTGLLSKNSCGTLFATAPETALDPGSLLCVENYVVNAVDESGALVPTTVST